MKLYNVLKNIIKELVTPISNTEIDELIGTTSVAVSDYVVEQGTSGIWTYRKWNSGVAECWGTQTYTLSNTGTVWVSPAYYYSFTQINYPFTFVEVPSEIATPVRSSANSYWIYKGDASSTNGTTTKTSRYGAVKLNSFTNGSTVTISFSVTGRWK